MHDDFWWVAYYRDGSCLRESGNRPGEHVYADIDLPRVTAFEIAPQRPGLPHLLLRPEPGQVPVFVRRRCIQVDTGDGSQQPGGTITILGWRDGDGHGSYAFVLPDGGVLLSSDFNAL